MFSCYIQMFISSGCTKHLAPETTKRPTTSSVQAFWVHMQKQNGCVIYSHLLFFVWVTFVLSQQLCPSFLPLVLGLNAGPWASQAFVLPQSCTPASHKPYNLIPSVQWNDLSRSLTNTCNFLFDGSHPNHCDSLSMVFSVSRSADQFFIRETS